jgi:predicted DNA-binding protein (MmcQ/YjbR family)
MFAVLGGDGMLSFQCSEVAFHLLTERDGIAPACHLGRAQWVALARADALDREGLLDFLRAAYGLILQQLPEAERLRLTEALKHPGGPV